MPRLLSRHAPATGASLAVGTVSMSHLGVDLIGGGFSALLPTLAVRHSLSSSSIGLLVAIYSVTALASQPLMGRLADVVGHAGVVGAMTAVATLLLASTAVAPNMLALVVVLVLGGLASAAYHPAGAVLVRRSGSSDPTSAIAWFAAAGTLGLAIGPIMVLVVLAHLGSWAVMLLTVPALWSSRAVWRHRLDRSTSDEIAPAADSDDVSQGGIVGFAIAATLAAVATTTLINAVPLWVADRPGGSTTDIAIGLGLATFSLATAAGGLLGSRIARRIAPNRFVPPALILGGVAGATTFVTEPGTLGFVAWLFVAGLLTGPVVPVLLVAAQDRAREKMAMVSGVVVGLSYGLAGVAFIPIAALFEPFGYQVGVVAGVSALIPAALIVAKSSLRPVTTPATPALLPCGCALTSQRGRRDAGVGR